MKNLVAVCFIFLISFATCNETAAYIITLLNNTSYSWVNSVSAEEKGGENSEESIKKNEVPEFSDNLFNHTLLSAYVQLASLDFEHDNILRSSGHAEEVFFPPEVL